MVGQLRTKGLGDAEVDHFRNGHYVEQRDQHVRWLEIAMDNTLLMSVLYGPTYLQEQF